MRGVYTATIKITGLAAAKTLLYITAPSTATVEILSAAVDDEGTNTTNQQLEVTWQKVNSLGTPTGTSLTPAKHEDGDQVAASTVVGNVTANEPSYSSNTDKDHQGFPSLAGYKHNPIPEERFYIAPSATYGLRMLSTPASFDCQVKVTFREIG